MFTKSILLSKFQKSQSAQKSHSLEANTAKTAKNTRKKGMTDSSIIGLMLLKNFMLCLYRGIVLKHSLVSPSPVTIAQTLISIIKSERWCQSTALVI